jgi:hypothetical protein
MANKKSAKKETRNAVQLSGEFRRANATEQEISERERHFFEYKQEVHMSRLSNSVTKDATISLASCLAIVFCDDTITRMAFLATLVCVVVGCKFMQRSCSQAIDDAYSYYVLFEDDALNRENKNRNIGAALDSVGIALFVFSLIALVVLCKTS